MQARARRNVRLLAWFNFCEDFRVYNAVAVVYFAAVTHSYALAGLVFSIAKISSAVFEIPTGVLSDLVARKFTLVCGQIAGSFAVLCYALGGSFSMLAAGAVLEGLSFALFSGNNDALLYDTLREEGEEMHFALHQGRLRSMFQFALAISALVAFATLRIFVGVSFAVLFWLSLAPRFVGFVLGFFLREPQRGFAIDTNIYRHLRESFIGVWRDRRLRLATIASVISFGIGESKFLLLPGFFALFWPAWGLGIARFLGNLFGAIGFRAGGWMVRRFGETRVLLAAMPFSVVAGVSAIVAADAASPVLYAFSSLPFGPAMVAQSSILQKAFTDRQRATMASIGAFAGSLFFAVAMFGLGSLADRVGLRYALLTAEFLSIPAIVLYWQLFGHERAERGT
jgi:MFS family permease